MTFRNLSLIAAAALAVGVAACGSKDSVTTDPATIPAAARESLTRLYPDAKVAQVKIDKETFGTDEYEVTLNNGASVDFRADGIVKKVKAAPGDTVPAGFLPDSVANYLRQNYADAKVVKYDVDDKDQEVKLSNGLELKFDLQGRYLSLDR